MPSAKISTPSQYSHQAPSAAPRSARGALRARPRLGVEHVRDGTWFAELGCVVEHPRDGVDDAEERQPARRGTRPRTPRWRRCRSPARRRRPRPAALASATAGNASSSSGRNSQVARRGPVAAGGRARAPGPASPGRARSAAACPAGWPGRASSRRRTRPSSGRPTAGAPRRRSGRSGTSNSRCASITSRPLLTSVAELIVTTGPMSQVGCASACSGVTSCSSVAAPAPERPAAGGEHQPAHLVRPCRRAGTGRAPSARSRPARSGPAAGTAALTSGPPATSDSLLASARVRPAAQRGQRRRRARSSR